MKDDTMGIEDMFPEKGDKYKTCPECCGTGKDNDTLDHICFECNGTGRIKKVKS